MKMKMNTKEIDKQIIFDEAYRINKCTRNEVK